MVELGGAKSSEFRPRYDQIPSGFLRALAERFTAGHHKFDSDGARYLGGRMNWQNGDAQYFRDRFNHVIEHLNAWKEDYEAGVAHSDQHLEAAAWGLAILWWAENQQILDPQDWLLRDAGVTKQEFSEAVSMMPSPEELKAYLDGFNPKEMAEIETEEEAKWQNEPAPEPPSGFFERLFGSKK
jgi:hypothetical protein